MRAIGSQARDPPVNDETVRMTVRLVGGPETAVGVRINLITVRRMVPLDRSTTGLVVNMNEARF